jgi:hypothetical protein
MECWLETFAMVRASMLRPSIGFGSEDAHIWLLHHPVQETR